MLKELVDQIARMGCDIMLPRVFNVTQEPSHVYYMLTGDGKLVKHFAQAGTRAHKASDLEAVVRWAKECHKSGDVEVWYSRHKVVCFLDANTRRDTVTLPMQLSSQIGLLHTLEKERKLYDQQSLINLLRITLDGGVPPSLVACVRALKFRTSTEGVTMTTHTKASIGRASEAEVSGAGIIPEDILVTVPVFDGFMGTRRFSLRCALDVDLANQKFVIQPFPGEAERAIREAEDALAEMLGDMLLVDTAGDGKAIPMFYGTP